MTDSQYNEIISRLDRIETKLGSSTKNVVAAKLEQKHKVDTLINCPKCSLKLVRRNGVKFCADCFEEFK